MLQFTKITSALLLDSIQKRGYYQILEDGYAFKEYIKLTEKQIGGQNNPS